MSVTVKLNYVRHSARKLRPVLSMFTGVNLPTAIDKTSLMTQDSAQMLHKALKMAKAAAEEKQFSADSMRISQVFATEGPRIKRSRANSRGRTNRYLKHLAHITVVLQENETLDVKKPLVTKPKIETKIRSKRG